MELKKISLYFATAAFICWFSALPVQSTPNDDCANAIALTVSEFGKFHSYTSRGAGSEPETVAPQPSCGAHIGGDVWFHFTAPKSGRYSVKKKNISAPTFFTFYTGTCGNLKEVQCSGQSNIIFNNPNLGGETIYVRAYAFFSNLGSDFEISVVDKSPPANDRCSEAFPLTVGKTCVYGEIFNDHSAMEEPEIAPTPSFGEYRGGDVWFTFTLPENGQVEINRRNMEGSHFYFAVYEGTCGDFAEVGCSFLPGNQLVVKDLRLAGETLFIRVFQRNSTHSGSFRLCLVTGDCHGVQGGDAVINQSGDCAGGNTGKTPCEKVIHGTVDWETACGTENASIEWIGTLSGSTRVSIEQNGHFSLTGIAEGTYDFYLKRDGFLRKKIENITIKSSGNELNFGVLVPGDITGNNAVGISDFAQFSSAYGYTVNNDGYNELTDFNCDEITNIQDFSLFGIYYGTAGD